MELLGSFCANLQEGALWTSSLSTAVLRCLPFTLRPMPHMIQVKARLLARD